MKRTAVPLIAAAFLLAGCGSAGSSDAGGTPAAARSSAPAESACAVQTIAWRNNGGESDIDAFGGALTKAQKAIVRLVDAGGEQDAGESALQSAAAALQSDAETTGADLPPACVPHLRADLSKACSEYSTAAQDMENGVTELSSNQDVAIGDMTAAGKQSRAADAKIGAAETDLTTWENDGEP